MRLRLVNVTSPKKRRFAKKGHFSKKALPCGVVTLLRNDAFVTNLRVLVSSNAHPWPERNIKFKVCSYAESCEKIFCKILNKKIGKLSCCRYNTFQIKVTIFRCFLRLNSNTVAMQNFRLYKIQKWPVFSPFTKIFHHLIFQSDNIQVLMIER